MRLSFLLVLLSVCRVCHADRDIVYSARYYTPPGSHRTSHFHIYRINPDGTGKTQLTFGSADEEMPAWTPDGQHIMFVTYPANSNAPVLCKMNGDGRHHYKLKVVAEYAWPPAPLVPEYRLDNSVADDNSASDKHLLIDRETGRRLILTVPDHDSSFNSSNDILLPMPGKDLVYAANDHNSTIGVDYEFYQLHPETGTLRRLTEGQFITWCPDSLRFCVAPGRDTTPYEKRVVPYAVRSGAGAGEQSEDKYRLVWFAPLYVRAASGGKMQQITPRLSYVDGADWRKEK